MFLLSVNMAALWGVRPHIFIADTSVSEKPGSIDPMGNHRPMEKYLIY